MVACPARKLLSPQLKNHTLIFSLLFFLSADPEGPGICAMFLTLVSFVLVLVTLPFSLCVTVKVVQEYERAVVFRLGRLRSGGAKGPGLFFVMPCVDSYKKVDLRTVSFDVPPQEVSTVIEEVGCIISDYLSQDNTDTPCTYDNLHNMEEMVEVQSCLAKGPKGRPRGR